MKNIVLFGAGKSAGVLINYLLEHAVENEWQLHLADLSLTQIQSRLGDHQAGKAYAFDLTDHEKRQSLISIADIVISLMPPSLHILIAQDCLHKGKNLLTASYIDPSLRALESDIVSKGLLFLCEMGLDPGIDHMSAMKLVDEIHDKGGQISSFLSHCGGLVSKESDDNPWHYKISWNPKNVIHAGKAGAIYRKNNREVVESYPELFSELRPVRIDSTSILSWYPNRDSLSYIDTYGLQTSKEFIRTTLRHPDFITGWSKIIELGLTDEEELYDTSELSIKNIIQSHLHINGLRNLSETFLQSPAWTSQWKFLGFDEERLLDKGSMSMADILQALVEEKLALGSKDKDLVVMKHEIRYAIDGKEELIESVLQIEGRDEIHTAMAATVGLPLGIAARLILEGRLNLTGLRIPTEKSIYDLVLPELAKQGIVFQDKVTSINSSKDF